MSVDESASPSLEIAHVLFMDVVGFSRLSGNQQQSVLGHLMEAARSSQHFMRAHKSGQLLSLPSGDGLAFVFFSDPEAPVQCAIEISRELRAHPDVRLRIGVHTGLVCRGADLATNRNISGGGVNIAQCVMDCGESGHILVSSTVAEVLTQRSGWKEVLHDLGEAEVHHGLQLRLYNLYTSDVGNSSRPRNTQFSRTPSSARGGGHLRGVPRPDELLGNTLGNYRVLRRLGAGGMGVIYEALDIRLGRHVALKLLSDQMVADDFALDRFRREAALASTLTHPHVCTLYDVGEEAGQHYIVMELLDGQNLRERMDIAPVETPQILEWMIQVTDALHFAHSQKIIHRDIKPANIFITKHGHAKILDFGLAKVSASAPSAEQEQLTSPGLVVGTLAYMSPEQARGEELDEGTDIFSLGAVMYEMATGKTPFPGGTTAIVLEAILNRQPIAPRTLCAAMPVELERIVCRCLAKERRQRYQNAGQLCEELKTLKRSLDSSAVLIAATHDAAAKNRKLARIAIPLGVVVVLGIASAIWIGQRHEKPREAAPTQSSATPVEPVAQQVSTPVSESISELQVQSRDDVIPTKNPQPAPGKATKAHSAATVVPPKIPGPTSPQAVANIASPAKTTNSPPTSNPFTGHYSGRFVTSGVPDLPSTLKVEEIGGVVRGCLHVARPSMAGGHFRGVASSNMLMITADTPAGRLEMQGRIQVNEFHGNYTMHEKTGTVRKGQFTYQRTTGDGLPPDYQESACGPN